MVMKKKFIEKSIKKHGDKYDYSKVEYVDSQTKVCIVCPEHGEFWQVPSGHVRGYGCPKCANRDRGKEKRKDGSDFVFESIKVHGTRYNYSKTKYINVRTKVCIICPEHGEFWQVPSAHLQGQGCPKCAGRYMDNNLFFQKAHEVHGDKYDYSKVEYVDSKTKVCIICPEHGEFWQVPSKHLYGRGCPKCGIEERSDKQKISYSVFLERVKRVHNNKYFYSNDFGFQNMHSKISVICPKHGEFTQLAYDHLSGHGCPKCAVLESNAEKEIYDFICALIGEEKVIKKDRNILEGKEIDIFVPEMNIGFEYNGLRWHSEEFNKDSKYHLTKTEKCAEKGIKLIQIFEDEYIQHKDIVLSKIKHILDKSFDLKKIYGRYCSVVEIDNETAKEFLDKNHIQGYGKSSICLSALYDGKIVGVMTFKKIEDGKWELTRFASDYNYVCCGVGGKIFKNFIERYNPVEIKSFADRRWTLNEENLYTKLGFELDGVLKPDYRYVYMQNPIERVHKFNFRKNTLHKKYGLPLDMTESKMAKEIGYSKIWDCGLYRYVWRKK
jgi:hypothetical protein